MTSDPTTSSTAAFSCAPRVELSALLGIPIIAPGDDLAKILEDALTRSALTLADGDVLVVSSKVVSRAEGRFVDLSTITASPRAEELARATDKDPRFVELVLRESSAVSRHAKGVLIVRHRLGFIGANAGIDESNAAPPWAGGGSGPWMLLLPEAPDASAERIRAFLSERSGAAIGVVISDSLGRPFRLGSVGAAIGLSGIPAMWDQRGRLDLFGRRLEHTVTAFADQVAAAADLVAGQAAEARCAVHVRGLAFPVTNSSAESLCRPADEDLYA